jgi:hypothetical protein
MIDNQADYDNIFRGKARLPRSPSHQGVAAQPSAPPASSAGFTVQTPVTTEVALPVKPKSPPPQVILPRFLFYLKKHLFNKRLIY